MFEVSLTDRKFPSSSMPDSFSRQTLSNNKMAPGQGLPSHELLPLLETVPGQSLGSSSEGIHHFKPILPSLRYRGRKLSPNLDIMPTS